MKKYNYDHLYYFWVTAKNGTMTRAAGILGISQPSLSSQLKVLEENLGYDVFKQAGRTIALTNQGASLYAICNDMFYSADQIEAIK